MNDRDRSPIPIHEVPTDDPDLKFQQLVVGQDRQQRPYVLTLRSHRGTGEVTAALGQTLSHRTDGQSS